MLYKLMPSKIKASGLIASVVVTALLGKITSVLWKMNLILKTSEQNTSNLNHQCKFPLLPARHMCAFSAGCHSSQFRRELEAVRGEEALVFGHNGSCLFS